MPENAATKIYWHLNNVKDPFIPESPVPNRFEAIGFPHAWPDLPWVFANMVASANGVVAWKRKGAEDDPVLAILGGDPNRIERRADKLLMRYLRTFGDMSIGAETNRSQPNLIQTPRESWDSEPELQEVYEALYNRRTRYGLSYHPKNIIYSPSGRLELKNPVFNTDGVEVIVITTKNGADQLLTNGAKDKKISLIVEDKLDVAGLINAHRKLSNDFGVRRLNCEGGETILRALQGAGILDEVFVTYTDVEIDESQHEGVLHIFDFEKIGAKLIAEGKINPESGYTFRRWRLNQR